MLRKYFLTREKFIFILSLSRRNNFDFVTTDSTLQKSKMFSSKVLIKEPVWQIWKKTLTTFVVFMWEITLYQWKIMILSRRKMKLCFFESETTNRFYFEHRNWACLILVFFFSKQLFWQLGLKALLVLFIDIRNQALWAWS